MTAARWFLALALAGWALLLIPSQPADIAWPLSVGWLLATTPTAWRRTRVALLIRTAHRPSRRTVKEHA